MEFIIAQLTNWSPRKYNYRFACVKITPNSIGHYQCINDSNGSIDLPDENWKQIR